MTGTILRISNIHLPIEAFAHREAAVEASRTDNSKDGVVAAGQRHGVSRHGGQEIVSLIRPEPGSGDVSIRSRKPQGSHDKEGPRLKFYTIKLPKFLGGIVKAFIGAFTKD